MVVDVLAQIEALPAARAGLQTSEARSKGRLSVGVLLHYPRGSPQHGDWHSACGNCGNSPPSAPLGETAKLRTDGSVSSCRRVSARDSPASCCLIFGVHPTSLIGVSLAQTAETPLGLHPVNETAARPTTWSCEGPSLRRMKVRFSASGTALEFMPDAPRKRVIAPYGAQKLLTNRIPSQRLLSVAIRETSAGLPSMCDAVRRPGRLTLCTGTNINSGAPATGDQRFSHKGFPARPLHDPTRLVTPVALPRTVPCSG